MTSEHTPLLQAVEQTPRLTQKIAFYIGTGIIAIVVLCVVLSGSSSNGDLGYIQARDDLVDAISSKRIGELTKKIYLDGPHLAGQNEKLALWTKDKFEEYGWEAEVETYDIWLNRPVDHSVALLDGDKIIHELSLEEDRLEVDETTTRSDRVPTFHGYSASGNVTGQLVYANFGRKRDYDQLVARGIDLKNKVVIVRYGGLFRGLKVKFAEELGASAVLIYSDPAEDNGITEKNGYEAYPYGPARNPSSVQRGSVQDLAFHPGDPTTPGRPSVPGADRDEPDGIVSIPSIPISYRDALPLLKSLNGHGPIFGEWQGDLTDVDYATGPSDLLVNVYNEQVYDFIPNRNVIARIKGEIDEEVVIGNHRDAWIIGGADPNSGSVVTLELARVFGELHKRGWKPYRTLVLASWDGEEYGLLGSTEHGEDHAEHIKKKALAYLNCDMCFSGSRFGSEASPLLSKIIYEVTKGISNPFNETQSVFEGWDAQRGGAVTGYLGSGSDYTVFQDYLGVPSLDMSYAAQAGDNVYHYHSNYDSYYWMTHFGDVDFKAHSAIAKIIGSIAIELVGSPVIGFSVEYYAAGIKRVLEDLLSNPNELSHESDALLDVADELVKNSKNFDAQLDQLREDAKTDLPWYKFWQKYLLRRRIAAANLKLFYLEREFIYDEGLDGRNWYKHMLFAPSRYTGYAGQVAPGIAEALEDHDVEKLSKWISIIQGAISRVSNIIE
ncbi:hypothetical protein B9G98_04120 [Wickerhamiella sorbophila]|uniref:Vacuolar protein sorting-associated protein 70 n=1 Tax=Wickerhamiella sorbophila TaxID=45607 RepID=A0A2T0FNE8_9ASCO|nr:hypothetical protein B9G98_04120 [Wickerhamiella sorbophila]PRT56500.1 hypothetical protein B9G98_04120 [Wickerhamiella sorbophila]